MIIAAIFGAGVVVMCFVAWRQGRAEEAAAERQADRDRMMRALRRMDDR